LKPALHTVAWTSSCWSVGNSVLMDVQSDACTDDGSEDSADEDFARRRKAIKTSCMGIAKVGAPRGAPKPSSFAPPSRSVAAQPFAANFRPRCQKQTPRKFVQLELLESGDDDDSDDQVEEVEDEAEEGGDDIQEYEEEDEPLIVTSDLLSHAPDGECNWDVWLSMTRRWPQLQIKIGVPVFFRRSGYLRVKLNVECLRELEMALQQERKERQIEKAERLKRGPEVFIREAERMRAMIGGRLKGGFVLRQSPLVRDLEEKQDIEQKLWPREDDQDAKANS